MKPEIVNVTPSKAKEWLARNVDNRRLRENVVTGLSDAIRRGEWILSHQGIAFGKSGKLLDGQHRLHAIVEAGMAAPMMVTWNVDDEAFKVTDIGTKRQASDILDISTGHAAVARFIAVVEDKTSRASLTPQFLMPFVHATAEPYARLNEFCSMTSKTWSSAAVRSAAILRMMDGADENHVLMTYYALVHLDYDSMPPIAKALLRQKDRGTFHAANTEMFVRCLDAFNPDKAHQRTIQIVSTATQLEYARQVIAREIRGQKKAPVAFAAGAKKTVNVSRHFTPALI